MTKTVSLKSIEAEYRNELGKLSEGKSHLSPDDIIEFSVKLFEEVKVEGISTGEDDEADMLLFQYGFYDVDENSDKLFTFDITRQFTEEDGEMYQLSLTLLFDAANFSEIQSYDSWSADFSNLVEWVEDIKSTEGYKVTQSHQSGSFRLRFDKQ